MRVIQTLRDFSPLIEASGTTCKSGVVLEMPNDRRSKEFAKEKSINEIHKSFANSFLFFGSIWFAFEVHEKIQWGLKSD